MTRRVKLFFFILLFIIFLSLFEFDLRNVGTDVSMSKSSQTSDVFFSNVFSLNGSDVSISNDGKVINFGDVRLAQKGDREVITYELTNGLSRFDVEGEIYINGVKRYVDEYFIIECSDIGTIGRNNSKEGTISIELRKDTNKNLLIPLDLSFRFSPIHKEKKFFGLNLF